MSSIIFAAVLSSMLGAVITGAVLGTIERRGRLSRRAIISRANTSAAAHQGTSAAALRRRADIYATALARLWALDHEAVPAEVPPGIRSARWRDFWQNMKRIGGTQIW